MRNKVITFCAAMGIPISSWGSTFGCTGICGSCQLSCLPGAAAVVILSVKIFSKKIAEKRRARYEKILLVLAAVMVMILLSSFKMQNEGDRSFKKIVLNKNKSVEYTVDVGKMGLLKYWLEPNVFSVALRCQTEDDTLKLRCETEGVDAIISQGSKKGIWKKLKSEDVLVKRSKNTVPINLEIAVPSKNIYRRNVQEGKIKIWNQDELYSVINLKIINSRYQ